MIDQQLPSSEELNPVDDKEMSRNEPLGPDSEEFQQQQHQILSDRMPFMKPFQIVGLNKQNFEQ